MARRLLGALTPPTLPYPPYINVSEEDGEVVVTLRTAATAPDYTCGETVCVRFDYHDFHDMINEVQEKMG